MMKIFEVLNYNESCTVLECQSIFKKFIGACFVFINLKSFRKALY